MTPRNFSMKTRSRRAFPEHIKLFVPIALAADWQAPRHLRRSTQCSPGTYSSNGQQPCTPCAAGTWTDQSGHTSCDEAQAGWYAPGLGSTSQTQCGQGYYSAAGASSCTVCPAGSYCNSNTNQSPTLCEPGRFSSSGGSGQDCQQCPAGTFNNVYGATGCCSCCSGFFNPQVGQTHCQACPNMGAFQQGYSSPGSTSAGACSAEGGASTSCSQSGNSCPGSSGPSQASKRNAIRPLWCKNKGHKSCPVYGNLGFGKILTRYECVDVSSDLESCGGCVDAANDGQHSADGGRDCSAIPNVDDVRCRAGKCDILACREGYTKSRDEKSCITATLLHGQMNPNSQNFIVGPGFARKGGDL